MLREHQKASLKLKSGLGPAKEENTIIVEENKGIQFFFFFNFGTKRLIQKNYCRKNKVIVKTLKTLSFLSNYFPGIFYFWRHGRVDTFFMILKTVRLSVVNTCQWL